MNAIVSNEAAAKRSANIRRGRIVLAIIGLLLIGDCIRRLAGHHDDTQPLSQEDQATAALISQAVAAPVPAKQADVMPADPSNIADVLAKAANVAAHPQDSDLALASFAFPVASDVISTQGYPIYLIECHVAENGCVGPQGQSIGTMEQVADQLTPIRGTDALNDVCGNRICQDSQGNYIGSISGPMQAYWDTHHGRNQ